MKVLIIDDSDYKVDHLSPVVHEVLPDATLEVARAFKTGLLRAIHSRPDLILLDISLPTFEVVSGEPGGRTRRFGGREILRELTAAGHRCKVIVVTQFDHFGDGNQSVLREDLMEELKDEFQSMFVAGIYYGERAPSGGRVAQLLKGDD